MTSMNKILENLWLGDMAAAYNKFLLKKHNITHVLTVASGIAPKFPTVFEYKVINILDSPAANIKQYFEECIQFIKDACDKGGCVLVHCFAGVSRSASVVIAYLMQEHLMSYNEAMTHVKKKRYFISPNEGFKKQLIQFARELKSERIRSHTKDDNTKVETMIKDPNELRKEAISMIKSSKLQLSGTKLQSGLKQNPTVKTHESETNWSKQITLSKQNLIAHQITGVLPMVQSGAFHITNTGVKSKPHSYSSMGMRGIGGGINGLEKSDSKKQLPSLFGIQNHQNQYSSTKGSQKILNSQFKLTQTQKQSNTPQVSTSQPRSNVVVPAYGSNMMIKYKFNGINSNEQQNGKEHINNNNKYSGPGKANLIKIKNNNFFPSMSQVASVTSPTLKSQIQFAKF